MTMHHDFSQQESTCRSFKWTFLHGLGDAPSSAASLLDLLHAAGDEIDAPDMNTAWLRCQDQCELATDRLANALLSGSFSGLSRKRTSRPHFLIGHSAGALVGLALALAERTSSFAGLVLIEGSLRATDVTSVRRYTESRDTDLGRQRLINELDNVIQPSGMLAEYRDNVAKTNPELFQKLAAELVERTEVGWVRLSRLDIPALYVAGALSPGSSIEELQPLRAMKGIHLVVIPNAAHWVHIDAPAVVASYLRKWASKVQRNKRS